MKNSIVFAFTLLSCVLIAFAGEVSVVKVDAHQRYPWNGKVDIVLTLYGQSDKIADTKCYFVATNSVTKEAIPVTHIKQNGSDSGSGTKWIRKFVWDCAADAGEVKIDDIALTVEALWCVQLWENGPYWAKCNLGASKPEEYGYYFWWGDTIGYKRNASNNGWVSIKDGSSFEFGSSNCPTSGKSNSELLSAGYIDSSGNLATAHDAATAHLGAPWRMPTSDEMGDLLSNCYTTWTTRNDVYGRLVTGRGAYSSKSIFLPAAGDGFGSDLYSLGSFGEYWFSTPRSDDSDYTWYLRFLSGNYGYMIGRSYNYRFFGLSVRPVLGFAK